MRKKAGALGWILAAGLITVTANLAGCHHKTATLVQEPSTETYSTRTPVSVSPTVMVSTSTSSPTATSPTQTPTPQPEQVEVEGSGIELWLREAGWPSYLVDEATSVALCESGGQPGQVNPGGFYGLFQISEGWFDKYGGQWSDPVSNASVAWQIYQLDNSWSQWSCKP